jgi:hypothetical protein
VISEQLVGWLDDAIDGGMLFELEPECPCPREHPWLYSDDACDAALRRQQLVHEASLETSRAIVERQQRERQHVVAERPRRKALQRRRASR